MRNTSRLYVALPITVEVQQIIGVSEIQDDGTIFLDLGEGGEPYKASHALIAHHQPGNGDYLVHETGELTAHSRDHILPKAVFERHYRPAEGIVQVPGSSGVYPWPDAMPFDLTDQSPAAIAWRNKYQADQAAAQLARRLYEAPIPQENTVNPQGVPYYAAVPDPKAQEAVPQQPIGGVRDPQFNRGDAR